jgi:muconolactone delta-isomerase
MSMEFLVEFSVDIPADADAAEVRDLEAAEAEAAFRLAGEGHLVRLWKPASPPEDRILGLYRAATPEELDALLRALPLARWLGITVTPLRPHPNDPKIANAPREESMTQHLPGPRLTRIYRLEATLGQPLDVGEVSQGHRRIVPLTGGTFAGQINGTLVPGASADWQVVLPDGTALGDIRYVLLTDGGDLLSVQSRSVRHGSPEVLARLGRGEDVDASEYTFRTSTQIETSATTLDWLNKGIFISVGGRQPGAVVYETYLVS